MMNAVIFCDVPCDWLTPLTGLRKAELPLCGRPVLSYVLSLLAHSGMVEQLWLVGASPALLSAAAGIGGLQVVSGAPMRHAETDTLVIGSMALFDCNLEAALRAHRDGGCGVTYLTKEMPPRTHAPLLRTEGNTVRGAGRAAKGDVYADTGYAIVSAGCPLTPTLLPLCESHTADFYAEDAVWEPLSSVQSYLSCQKTVLHGWLEAGGHKRLDGLFTPTADSFSQAAITPPVFVGHRVRVGAETVLSETVLGNGVTIGSGASLIGCTVQDGAYIGDGVQARDALICGSAMVMNGCRLEAGSAVGEGASVGERAVVEERVRVFAGKRVAPRTTAELDVRHATPSALSLGEERVCGTMTPTAAVRLGSSLARAAAVTAVGYSAGQPAARALAQAVAAGISAGGAAALLVPDATLPELCHASVHARADLLLHIDAGAEATLKLYATGGLPMLEVQEELLEQALDTRTVSQMPHGRFGAITELASLRSLYEITLEREFAGMSHPPATVSTASVRLRQLGNRLFSQGVEQAGLLFQLSTDGRQLTAYSDDTGFVRQERLLLLCCLAAFATGDAAALPVYAPQAAERIAATHGGRVLRYHPGAVGSPAEMAARSLALTQRFTLDGLFAAGYVLRYLSAKHLSLAAALDRLPPIHISRRLLPAGESGRRALRRLCTDGDGTMQRVSETGRLTFCPTRGGQSVAVYAEAASMEAAAELVAEAERLLGR